MNTGDEVELDGSGEELHVEQECTWRELQKDLALIQRIRISEQPKSESFISEAMAVTSKDLGNDYIGCHVILTSAKRPIRRRKFGRPAGSKRKSGKGTHGKKRVLRNRCMEVAWDEENVIYSKDDVLKGCGRTFSTEEAFYMEKAYVLKSSVGQNQREKHMWTKIKDM